MGLLRRVVAILMMVVFLPASVLAGTPLRLCVGEDGHRAIEFVISADHHAAGAQSVECAEPHDQHAAPSSACTDSQLLSEAQQPASLADLERQLALEDLLSFAVLLTIVASPALSELPEAEEPQPYYGVRREPQLDALRTVVLLI